MEEQKLVIENFDKALVYVDKVLPLLPDFSHFNLSTIIINSNWIQQDKDEAYNLDRYIQVLLIDRLKYVDGNVDAFDIELNDTGRQVKKAGGHFAYLQKLDEKAVADAERQKLNDEKLKYDIKNAKRIFKTYWWTFAISIAAFLLSLFNLIYNLFIHNN